MISVDGSSPGPPLLRAAVSPGPHTVRVTAPGYAPRELSLRADANLITAETIALQEIPAHVKIADADGATVYVDGHLEGDMKALTLPPGRHFVSVVSTGRESMGQSVDLGRADDKTVTFARPPTVTRYASLALLGVGGASIVSGLVCFGVAGVRDGQANQINVQRLAMSIPNSLQTQYASDKADRDALRTAGIATTSAGAGVAAIGLTLFFLDRPRPITPPEERPRDTPSDRRDRPSSPGDLMFLPEVGPDATGLWLRGHL
jgi:hypothetical protein